MFGENKAGTCKYTYNPATSNLNQTTWGYTTTTNDENSIATALNQYGPIAVSIDATNLGAYKSAHFRFIYLLFHIFEFVFYCVEAAFL